MRILFLCVANSARSQIAEGLARAAGVETLEAFSAGSLPAELRPEAIEVLQEWDIDIRGQTSKGVDSIPLDSIELVITLCKEEICPLLPGHTQYLHWPIEDPARNPDAPERVRLFRFREARDEIARKLDQLWLQLDLRARKQLRPNKVPTDGKSRPKPRIQNGSRAPHMNESNQRVHLLISGRVQGVFYRASTRDQARKLGLVGWVRNCPNGAVEALAEGPRTDLEALVRWCADGPAFARVEKVQQIWHEATGEFSEFRVRH